MKNLAYELESEGPRANRATLEGIFALLCEEYQRVRHVVQAYLETPLVAPALAG